MKNKKIWIGVVATVVAVILIITAIYINVSKSLNAMKISNPELAKAIEYDQFVEGDEAIDNTDNVKFSAFFLRDLDGDGYAEKIKGTCKTIGEEDTLYMEIIVQTEGYLKNAKIEINGQNFYLQTALPKDEQLKDNYIGNNVKSIEFNQLNNGTQKLLTGVVRSGDYSFSSTKNSAIGNNINNYSRTDNKIILTGTYVGENSEEIQITKEIPLTVDWYGTANTTISAVQQTYNDLPNRIDEVNETIKLNFKVNTNETQYMLNLSKNHVEGTIPELNGYVPTQVKMINTTSENLTFEYNQETRTFTIERIATLGQDGTITTSIARNNSYEIEITYPIEAYESAEEEKITISIPVQAYYEGYNNTNEQFTNPYKSNIANSTIVINYSNPQGDEASLDITVGKKLYSPISRYMVSKQKPLKIYNGTSEQEVDDTYIVRWYAYTGTDGETTKLVLKESQNGQSQVSDEFIKTDSTLESMENVTQNIGIYFTGADSILKEDGWIKVYDDENDNLLGTFTKENWNTYTSSNPYKYELPVKHIRVETSETNKATALYVYNIKELDDELITTNYTKEQFDNLQYIKSTLSGYIGENYIGTISHQANYETPYSIATIGLSNSKISTQKTEENQKITINANYDVSSNQIGWKDGSFLVKLPDEILTAEINSVQINNSSVAITSYEIIEETGKFIKINTKNYDENSQSYIITIDTNITPDPRIASVSREVELYATNEECNEYYYKGQDIYDVNDNLNITETINKATTTIDLISPNSLLTSQTASEYDSKNSVVISPEIADIAPKYVKVDNEKQTAKVGVQVKNNYASTISEVMILGKIPFEGNTTVISQKNLNSEFTTKMQSDGIEIPEELQGKVNVYYSENEIPDKDLSNTQNGWKTGDSIGNWGNIKTYLIDFENEKIPQGAEYVFYYTIEIPEGIEFNKISYSHHGIYFCLDTDQGKYRTQTEPNKLGFRIAEKYNLELIKTQTWRENTVTGATYSIKEVLEDGTLGKAKTGITNEQGTLTIKNLYAEKTYEIQEIKSPNDYELNEDVIQFVGRVDENGTLTIEKLQGTTKEDITITKNEGEMHKVTVQVEDEAKAKLKITKKEQGTENTISNVKYKLTGAGLPINGRILTTNLNGEVSLNGLKIDEEYTLEETKATGYYLANPIKFKIVNNEGNYSIETIEGTITQNSITEENNIPIINLTMENEKIPTYNLEISKIKKVIEEELNIEQTEENVYLQGAKFKLYKDDKEIDEYITDENGKITITNLYQFVEGKDEQATYTLKEVVAPDGYAKVKDMTFKVQEVDSTLRLINTSGEAEKYTVDGTTVKLTIEDSPTFKLIKKDGETGETVPNVKFAIYNIDEEEVPATNGKGEIIGNKETINGKQYYTLTTDSNGTITADLTEGLYKAVEVEAPDKYDIENSIHYFGIGASKDAKKIAQALWGNGIGGSENEYISSVNETSDGGVIVGGIFSSSSISLGNEVILINSGYSDGMIIKYDSNGKAEWAKAIGGNESDEITTVIPTSDGGYLVGGSFASDSINLGNGISISTTSTNPDAMIIKYDSDGKAEWAKTIGDSTMNDSILSLIEIREGGYIVNAHIAGTFDLGNGVTVTSNKNKNVIIKYTSDGTPEWAKTTMRINSIKQTSDDGYIAIGNFGGSNTDLGITISCKGELDGAIIKYDSKWETEWVKTIGGTDVERIYSVAITPDEGYIIAGDFHSSTIDLGNGVILTNNGGADGLLIKYSANGEIEWAKVIGGNVGDSINSVEVTKDGGWIVSGTFKSDSIDLGNEIILTASGNFEGMIIKFNKKGNTEWAKSIKNGGNMVSVIENSNGDYIACGYFSVNEINLGDRVTITKSSGGELYYNDGMLFKYKELETEAEIPETQELIVENERKELNITTSVNTIDGIKGGTISGEDEESYEKVKYGDSNTKEILMTPDEGYEIIKITINGEEHSFTQNEDNTYTVPILTDITEDQHIEVTYALKDNKITINKIDSQTKEGLSGATFKLDQIEEREVPENVIGTLTDNGQEYYETDLDKEVTNVFGKLTDNGQGYNVTVDTTKEVTDVLGELTNNGTYYFIEQDGKYVPTNGKTYQTANGGTAGIGNTTANSYIEIDLSNKTGDYVVIVNANVSSQGLDYGYATITETTVAPHYSSISGRIVCISGTSSSVITAKDYTSIALIGGRKYYLHLGYRKSVSTDTGKDQIEFNSIKVYEATCERYNFIENEGKYESTNQGQANTTSNSYIPIDLTEKIGHYALVVNANVSSELYNDYGYAIVRKDRIAPLYGEKLEISGTSNDVTTPTDYEIEILEGGEIYYLHLGYRKNGNIDSGDDKFTVNSIKLYETKTVTYNFIENNGKYESTNQGKQDTVANSYIPIDLTEYEGKYNLIVNANISSEEGDIGYAIIGENTERLPYYSSYRRLIYITGTSESATTPTDYTIVLEGGRRYYLHLGYYKNSSISEGDDKFTINNITITPNEDDLYHTEITTNSQGQSITQIPFGKYAITEIKAPDGYELNENSVIAEFREGGEHEFTLENNKLAKVIVHHYIKGTKTKVAEDDLLQDKAGYPYTTTPKLDLEKYELEIGDDGKHIIPENATGQFKAGEQEVIYYYVEKQIPLVVNHYIEGTEESVPLSNGKLADTITTQGNAGETYTTTAIPDSELSSEYELVEIPDNSTGTYEGDIIEVTYYYKQVVRRVTINKYREDGSTPLEGAVFTIVDKNTITEIEPIQYTTNDKGKIEVVLKAGEYIITEIQAPLGYQLPENPTQEISISRETEQISLDIRNIKKQGDVIVHYYIENSTTPVLLEDGTSAKDVIKTGNIGDMYVTQKLDNVDSRFELKEIPENASGNIKENTIEVIYYYKMPAMEEKSTIEKKATDKVTTKDAKIYYEIKFTSTINYFNGIAKIILVDELPYSINVEESELAGGTYDEATKTITWEEELNNLPVIIDEMTIERTKVVNLKYNYENIDGTNGIIENKVSSRIELYEQNQEKPDEYIPIKVDERETIAETLIEIPTQVKVHHYIYDVEKNEFTTVKLAEDETINGIIGQEYKTVPSESIPSNYSCINIMPEKFEGKMTEEVIEVNYYYQLITPTIENNINKLATIENAILTKEDGEITYDITYNVTIKDYIGKATIEIIDKLPAAIDTGKSELSGGIYDNETKTIKWTEILEEIDTFADGEFAKEITKQIKVVYKNQNVIEDLENTVTGTTKTYYPENYPTTPGGEQLINSATDKEIVKQQYKVKLQVEKQWDDNDDLKEKRPESVTIVINGIPNQEPQEYRLNEENEWKTEIIDLPKYDLEGNKIIYEVTEKETEEGDLEFYEDAQITSTETQTEEETTYTYIVKNGYKLFDTDLKTEISKQGTEEITSSKQEIEYTINFKSEIIDYIGSGKIRLVDTLPYKIDEEKSDLAEGIYDHINQTITWEEELLYINTEKLEQDNEQSEQTVEGYKVDITKQIKVVYEDINLSTQKMTNHVSGKIELYETDMKDEKETTYDTNINVNGKVIVRYVDKDTGKDIDEKYNYEIISKVGDGYITEKKEIENYEYIESTKNEKGTITEENQEVIYYYTKVKTTVLVKYQDTDGNQLAEDELINGKISDKYATELKEIENYRLVQVPDNKDGIMTREEIVVIYVYEKIPAKVIVKYLEKDSETGEERELLPQETIEGVVGDEYETERKVIENYKIAEPEPDNKTGKMTEETIEVKYYYEKIPSGTITVRYIDIDTKEEITHKTDTEEKSYRYEIKGYIGDEYESEQKEIPYYEFVESTENVKGILTEKEDTVTYYYRKLTFNFSIEKTITGITLNGEAVNVTNNKLSKIEARTKQIEKTELIVNYNIKVINNGEMKGKAVIEEIIPEGYEVIQQEAYWEPVAGKLETEVELDVNEEKDLTVKLRWKNNSSNVGIKNNIAQIRYTQNLANYEEITTDDNTSNAQVIIGITTGPKFETLFKVELAMSVVIILLLILNTSQVSMMKFLKKK